MGFSLSAHILVLQQDGSYGWFHPQLRTFHGILIVWCLYLRKYCITRSYLSISLVLSRWHWCGWQGYLKRLRELFILAGYQTSAEQWRLQAEAAVATDETKQHDAGEFETLYECRAVGISSCWTCLCLKQPWLTGYHSGCPRLRWAHVIVWH